LIRTENVSV